MEALIEIALEILLYPVGYAILVYIGFDKSDINKYDSAVEMAGFIGWIFIGLMAYSAYRILF
ncbi:MAG TPA: hypothetical protein VNN73_22990 [Blastocatellia bacterium]|nr:hypothetical protein [Blastocatellia bacterium]